MKFYECRFAPCAATWRDVIGVAQLVRSRGEAHYECFSPDAFKGWGTRDIAILLDHDDMKRAGTVTALAPHGEWWHASFVLDGPHAERAAEYIERGGKVSPGFNDEEKDPIFAKPITPHHNATHWHTRAQLNEISILGPGVIPWYLGAKVTRCYEPRATEPPAVREELAIREVSRRYVAGDLVIDRSDGSQEILHGAAPPTKRDVAAGQVFGHGEQLLPADGLIRPGIGQVLGIR